MNRSIDYLFLMMMLVNTSLFSQVLVEEHGALPISVANNAVCEGFVNGKAFIYSFGGIDSTKLYSGIHLKSYKYDIESGATERIADLPDNMGKIAAGASRIGDVIYIIGGYHVMSNGTEISSRKVHRYDLVNNVFLSDAPDLLVATDDHVQAVWRDSLIYVISGWSNNGNISNVQIYNSTTNSWRAGIPVPNTNDYKSFGASGTIVGDKIYYFGGASGGTFAAQNQLRIGLIDPSEPVLIDWSINTPDAGVKGYRMAATTVGDSLYWVGGSDVTYNFDGIAYNGTGGVPTTDRVLFSDINDLSWETQFVALLPMDLRGIAEVSDTVKYIVGGMIDNQTVSNKVFKLSFRQEVSSVEVLDINAPAFKVFPNPATDEMLINNPSQASGTISLYNAQGSLLRHKNLDQHKTIMGVKHFESGYYYIKISGDNWVVNKPVFIGHK